MEKLKTFWALCLYCLGKKWSCSTFIDEDSITMGYGPMTSIGGFKYNLPEYVVKSKHNGCILWSEYLNLYRTQNI